MRQRTLFTKWLLLNAAAVVFLIVLGVTLGGRLHGVPLISIPVILAMFFYANVNGAKICWQADEVEPETPESDRLLHEAEWLRHWAWMAQTTGILSAVVGFYILLSGGVAGTDTASNQELHDRILEGGVVFTGTFVGVFCSQVLEHTKRMIDHALAG